MVISGHAHQNGGKEKSDALDFWFEYYLTPSRWEEFLTKYKKSKPWPETIFNALFPKGYSKKYTYFQIPIIQRKI